MAGVLQGLETYVSVQAQLDDLPSERSLAVKSGLEKNEVEVTAGINLAQWNIVALTFRIGPLQDHAAEVKPIVDDN